MPLHHGVSFCEEWRAAVNTSLSAHHAMEIKLLASLRLILRENELSAFFPVQQKRDPGCDGKEHKICLFLGTEPWLSVYWSSRFVFYNVGQLTIKLWSKCALTALRPSPDAHVTYRLSDSKKELFRSRRPIFQKQFLISMFHVASIYRCR
jgi:hypothetical protein